MSKKIIIILALIAIVAGGYWFMQQQSSDGSSTSGASASNLLNRIPADTVLFMGGLETIPIVNPYDAESITILTSSLEDQIKQIENAMGGDIGPAGSILTSLYMDFAQHFYSAQLTEMNDFAFYTLGVYPVAVWQSTDIQAFTDKLNAIEKEKNITPRSFALENAELREYLIHEDAPVKMYIAINDNIVSIGAVSDKQEILKLFAGVDFPEKNLANTNKLQQTKSAHKLLPFAMGYFDSNAAMQNLASNEDNLLKQTLNELSEGKAIAEITGNACFNDATKIIARWPRMVFGYRSYDIKSSPIVMDAAIIFEHTDSKFLNSLKGILGSLSDYSFEQDILSMGVGINIDNLASFLTDFRKDILNETYQCEGLLALQQQLEQNNPAMLAMGAQMVAGAEGVSVHLTKIDIEAATAGDITAAKGMAVITAKNPKNLLLAASNFYPPLSEMTIEANGESHSLALPMGVTADIAMSDNAITLQFGDSEDLKTRIADIHQGNGLSSSFFRLGMNFSTYFKMIDSTMSSFLAQAPSQDTEKMKKQMKEMIALFEALDMKFVYDFNVEDKGIVIAMKVSMNNPSK